jgi:hypothetical protein
MMIPRSIRLGILLAGLAATGFLVPVRADGPPDRTQFTLRLKRGDFIVYRFVPADPKFAQHPRAVVIFGSGDGGFDGSEDHVGHALESQGYEMLGFDCSAYADTDYDLATLQEDTTTIAESSLSHEGPNPPPLILGGWSMGAAQAVAAAGGPHPPPGVVGLLLLSPEDRGRYGVRETDRIDVPPTGPGTFALEDFAHSLGNIRVAQWSASWDPFCSDTWFRSLTAPHKAFILPHAFHDYDEFDDGFMKVLMDSVAWILSPGAPAAETAKSGGP